MRRKLYIIRKIEVTPLVHQCKCIDSSLCSASIEQPKKNAKLLAISHLTKGLLEETDVHGIALKTKMHITGLCSGCG